MGAGISAERFRRGLKRHRLERRWSQEHLALESDVDHSLVSRVESGKRQPTRDFIVKIARGLDLADADRDQLLVAAGYVPVYWPNLIPDHTIRRLWAALEEVNDLPDDIVIPACALLEQAAALLEGARALAEGRIVA